MRGREELSSNQRPIPKSSSRLVCHQSRQSSYDIPRSGRAVGGATCGRGTGTNITTIMGEESLSTSPITRAEDVSKIRSSKECCRCRSGTGGARGGVDVRLAQHPGEETTK